MDNTKVLEYTKEKTQGKLLTGLAALDISARIWFVVAFIGLWIFASYLIAFYGSTGVQGQFSKWSEVLPTAIVDGDPLGNTAIIGHITLALIIIVFGPLQFIPFIRNRYRTFHRWNGRVYLITGLVTSIFGLYMVWIRGSTGDLIQHIGITGDAVLIITFAVFTIRYAMARRFDKHNRWAFRLFLVMNAVWFFRIGLMLWIFVNGGPAGFDPVAFKGPFLSFWTFGQYVLPLFFAELYFRTRDHGNETARYAMAAVIFILTLATGTGIFAATMMLWLPHM